MSWPYRWLAPWRSPMSKWTSFVGRSTGLTGCLGETIIPLNNGRHLLIAGAFRYSFDLDDLWLAGGNTEEMQIPANRNRLTKLVRSCHAINLSSWFRILPLGFRDESQSVVLKLHCTTQQSQQTCARLSYHEVDRLDLDDNKIFCNEECVMNGDLQSGQPADLAYADSSRYMCTGVSQRPGG